MNHIENRYFDWLCHMVASEKYPKRFYHKLLRFLHGQEFTYTIAMDGNRACDGIDLRYRFGHERRIDRRIIATELDVQPCSVLEMLVALSIRCEEHIMADEEEGDRTGQWFWSMIENLGLGQMQDDIFDEDETDHIVQRFLNREYGSHGEGGLVTITNPRRDLRSVEIWFQMMWHLNDILYHI